MKKLWPIVVVLKKDELLSSWIIRSSLANGSDPMRWSSYFWGKWRAWTVDIDRHCNDFRLAKLCFGTFNLNILQNSTLAPTLNKIVNKNLDPSVSIWPWLTRSGSRNRDKTGGLRCCSDCIKENAYYRKEWRFSWVHSCDKHQRLLLEYCPKCNSAISPHKVSYLRPEIYRCQQCFYDYRLAPKIKINKEALVFQNIMTSALESHLGSETKWGFINHVELFMTSRYLLSYLYRSSKSKVRADQYLCHTLNLPPRSDDLSNISSIEELNVDEISLLSSGVMSLYKMPINNVINLFNQINLTQQGFNKIGLEKSPQINFIIEALVSNSHWAKKTNRVYLVKPNSVETVKKRWNAIQKHLR